MISKANYEDMYCIATAQEVKMALWDIKGEKSLGPDGYNSTFSRKLGELLVLR